MNVWLNDLENWSSKNNSKPAKVMRHWFNKERDHVASERIPDNDYIAVPQQPRLTEPPNYLSVFPGSASDQTYNRPPLVKSNESGQRLISHRRHASDMQNITLTTFKQQQQLPQIPEPQQPQQPQPQQQQNLATDYNHLYQP